MGCIDEHHAHDLLAMAGGKYTDVVCSEGGSNENVSAGNQSAGEEALQFVGNIRTGARLMGSVAPTETGAIVGTNVGKSTDLWLHQLPNNGSVAQTGIHDDRGTSRARTVDVKAQPTDVDEFAGTRIAVAFPLRHRELKYGTGGYNQGQ